MPDPVIKKIVRDVVREEIKPVEERLNRRFDAVENRITEGIKDLLYEFRSDMAKLKDEIVGEIEANREEQTLLNARSAKINDIEDEVEKLKNIHPHNSHQPATA